MARGPVKHQKRLSAPSHWLLDKLSGAYAPKASPGPHKLRDSLPLVIFLRNHEEAQYKLGKVKRVQLGKGGIPYLVTHDARTIRYPDPAIKVNDTVKVDLSTGKISDFIKFDTGVIVMVTGGRNMGRVGVITHRERHDGGFNIVHIKDAVDNEFTTRESNVIIIGKEKPWISLPKGKGVKLSIAEERDRRRAYALAGH
ncbi:hypothetical protein GGP41_010417 [Bipolaris sorokiniana]|uniref:40S ribosomal protein S4 n=1 Tax=Cochliobolus sativus TaxID=45130 RepID=A0A8H6DWR4_COCSA|nr:hypothetical protein GGP41_010417 [Bipolaris sorokiniana]